LIRDGDPVQSGGLKLLAENLAIDRHNAGCLPLQPVETQAAAAHTSAGARLFIALRSFR